MNDGPFEINALRRRWARAPATPATPERTTEDEVRAASNAPSVAIAVELLDSIASTCRARPIEHPKAIDTAIEQVRRALDAGDVRIASTAAETLEQLLIAVLAPGER